MIILCVLFTTSCFVISKAQVPMTNDVKARSIMHIAIEAEKAETLRKEVSEANAFALAHQLMLQEELHSQNELLRERGSLTLSDGTALEENKALGTQPIDPRTPAGFGDPFFRKIHVEMNKEMNMSPMMAEALKNQTSDIDLEEDACTGIKNCVDYDGDGFNDAIEKWEKVIRRNITHFNANYFEVVDDVINRTLFYNGSKIDYVTSKKCVTSYGTTTCSTSEHVFNEYFDEELSLFPDGICPHPCECVRSLAKTKKKANELVEKCFEYCSGHSLIDIFHCKMLMSRGISIRTKIKALLDEKAPGWGKGLKLKRKHPLGKDIKRFMGVF